MRKVQSLFGFTSAFKMMMAQYLSHLTKSWQNGEITNFEYLIKLNSAAGRSFLDLTQYPVFPWVLADYSSPAIDLTDPSVYRDLSRPMGALGSKRESQFRERYKTMAEFQKEGVENTSPPFHYGTHYSCAGYVLYYLLRLEPYSSNAVTLQGGQFDISDRLFLSIEHSWRSASSENLQDVRELIPEFYYLPEFLMNTNDFDFGTTQRGEKVHDVDLPLWAHSDPREFIRIHREALESKYVSENLNDWIDLIFGYKQRGIHAEQAMNVFIHVTYDGEVDIDAITDPIVKAATIAQINNFGQTPSMLFHRPHPKKHVPEIFKKVNETITIDSTALSWHSHLYPPLTSVGSQKIILNKLTYLQLVAPGNPQEAAVSDIRFHGGKIVALPRGYVFIPPSYKKIIKYGVAGGGLVILSHHPTHQRFVLNY